MIHPQAFVKNMKERHLFNQERNRVVVACSGGPDSLYLMYLLWACREPLNLDLSVLTCDHGIRPENDAEALDVRQRAWAMGLPCAFRRLHVPENQCSGESLEMTGRRLRRKAYAEVAAEFGARQVALGHHLDDQAETVLLRLLRGTGSRGAGGMAWSTPLNASVSLVRPLLDTRRSEIEEGLTRWGQQPFQDPSNQSREFTRNRIRLDVMPLLEKINPGVARHLSDFAEDQRRLEAWAGSEARSREEDCLAGDALRLEPWRFLPDVIRERILLGWFRRQGGQLEEVSRAAWNRMFHELAQPQTESRRWELGGIPVQAEGGYLTAGLPLPAVPLDLAADSGRMECELLGRLLRMERVDHVDKQAAGRKRLDGPLTAFVRIPEGDFQVRSPVPGDRYRPMGMKGRAKVSDLMINAKVPARLRSVWPVIAFGEEIVWIPGFRVAELWKVTEPPCIRLTFEPGEIHTFCG